MYPSSPHLWQPKPGTARLFVFSAFQSISGYSPVRFSACALHSLYCSCCTTYTVIRTFRCYIRTSCLYQSAKEFKRGIWRWIVALPNVSGVTGTPLVTLLCANAKGSSATLVIPTPQSIGIARFAKQAEISQTDKSFVELERSRINNIPIAISTGNINFDAFRHQHCDSQRWQLITHHLGSVLGMRICQRQTITALVTLTVFLQHGQWQASHQNHLCSMLVFR